MTGHIRHPLRRFICANNSHGTAVMWLLRICLVGVISVYSLHAVAEEPKAPKSSDVRLVIDISGSMKKNDPKNLRRPALDMLVQLLPKGSKAGIWTFGQSVNMIVPHGNVDKKWGKKALAASPRIQSIAQFTNIGEALEKAAYDHQRKSGDYQTHIILLTDGMVDIDRDSSINKKERQRIINAVLPLYQQAGFTLHTIALSDNADKLLLNKLALATDGKAAVAKTAEELMNVFLQVFDQAVPSEEAPFDGSNFLVDSSIEEFTALIFRQPNSKDTQIISPDGQTYNKTTKDSRIRWHHTDKYDLITIKQPLEGEWKVSADLEPQSRITVVSDLSLVVKSMPTNIPVNEAINTSLALREDNKTVTRVEFLGLLDIDVNITSDNGKIWTDRLSTGLVPVDGVYSTVLNQFDQEGEYKINFVVDGKSFNRQFTHHLSVRKPFLVDVKKEMVNGKNQFIVQVVPQSQNIELSQTVAIGHLKKPSGKGQALAFSSTDDGHWQLTVNPEEQGEYSLSIGVQGKDKKGKEFDISLETVRLSQVQDDAVFSPEKKEVKEKPVAPVTAPPVADSEEEKPAADEEPVVDEQEDSEGMMQLILYGIIGFVNILIIVVAYFIYRKLFKKKPVEDDGDSEGASEDESGFTEPPMDEMAVEDLEEEEEIEEKEEVEEAKEQQPMEEEVVQAEDAVEEIVETNGSEEDKVELDNEEDIESSDLALDDDLEGINLDDEEDIEDSPDFSLDDFSPESLEDDDVMDEMDEPEK